MRNGDAPWGTNCGQEGDIKDADFRVQQIREKSGAECRAVAFEALAVSTAKLSRGYRSILNPVQTRCGSYPFERGVSQLRSHEQRPETQGDQQAPSKAADDDAEACESRLARARVAAVLRTSAVSSPGVMVSRLAAATNAARDTETDSIIHSRPRSPWA